MASHSMEFGAGNSGLQVGHNSGSITFGAGDSENVRNQNCLQHLRSALGTDPRDDKTRIERVKGGLLRDAYLWVLSNPNYRQWHNHPDSGLLWVKGDPGKGKTMLLCGLIDELSKSTPDSTILSFSFCQSFNAELNSALSVLLGLVYLLVENLPSLISHVRDQYDQTGDRLFKDVKLWDALVKVFAKILADPILKKVYLAIDALDECMVDQPLLLDLISKLSSEHRHIKWVVTSRNDPEIEDRLYRTSKKIKLSLELSELPVSEAVGTYIRHKVQKLAKQKNYQPELCKDTLDYLLSNSQGTFLWVSLVCDELNSGRAWKARSLLTSFPPGLEPLYRAMMDRIRESEDCTLYKRILAVVLIAFRPLSLDEFVALVDLPNYVSRDDETLAEIISGCRSFLTIRTRTVHFVHLSVKEFLMKWEAQDIFPMGVESEHQVLFQRSLLVLETLKRDIYQLKLPDVRIDHVRRPSPDPLVQVTYSCIYWIDHFRKYHKNRQIPAAVETNGPICTFFRHRLLNWFEALSLLGSLSQGISALLNLRDLLQSVYGPIEALELAQDASRFVQYFRYAIERWPLQIYSSPLVFSPTHSLTRLNYQADRPEWAPTPVGAGLFWNSCILTLEGHEGGVSSIAWSPDDRQLAVGSAHGIVKIWDTNTGCCLTNDFDNVILGSVTSLAWSPDGTRLASGLHNGKVVVWDMGTMKPEQEFNFDEDYSFPATVERIIWLRDRSQLTVQYTEGIKIWDLITAECVNDRKWDLAHLHIDSLSPDGRRIATAGGLDRIDVCDLLTGRHECTLHVTLRDSGGIFSSGSIFWSPSGNKIALVDDQKKLKIWDSVTGQLEHLLIYSDLRPGSFRMVWSPDECRLAIMDSGGRLELLDLITLQTRICIGNSNVIEDAVWSRDSDQLATLATKQSQVQIWDSSSGELLSTLDEHTLKVTTMHWSQHGKRLVTGSNDPTVRLWDLNTILNTSTQRPSYEVLYIEWCPDETRVLTSSADSAVRIWDSTSGDCILLIDLRSNSPGTIAWSHDGSFIAVCANSPWPIDKEGLPAFRRVVTQADIDGQIFDYVVDPEIHRTEFTSSMICILNPHSGKPISLIRATHWLSTSTFVKLEAHKVRTVAWSHDQRKLASDLGSELSIGVWDTATLQCIATLCIADLRVFDSSPSIYRFNLLAWSPDGSLLAALFSQYSQIGLIVGSAIGVWHTETWQIVAQLPVPGSESVRGRCTCLRFDPCSPTHLIISCAMFDLKLAAADGYYWYSPPQKGPIYGFKNDWITYNGKDVIWLPPEYRTGIWATSASGTSLALRSKSGHVLIFHFSSQVSSDTPRLLPLPAT